MTSIDFPLVENANIRSSASIIPRSPCPASAGWMKKEGVPVEDRVAANFCAINPALPIPVVITFPGHVIARLIEASKSSVTTIF